MAQMGLGDRLALSRIEEIAPDKLKLADLGIERRDWRVIPVESGLITGDGAALAVRQTDNDPVSTICFPLSPRRMLVIGPGFVRTPVPINRVIASQCRRWLVDRVDGDFARSRVPIPPFLAAELAELARGRSVGALVFGDGVHHLNQPTVKGGWWVQSIGRAQVIDPGFPTPTIHDLRHTAASLAVSAGANVKAVRRMLGHASAAMTLDVYADLFDEDLKSVSMASITHELQKLCSFCAVLAPSRPPDYPEIRVVPGK